MDILLSNNKVSLQPDNRDCAVSMKQKVATPVYCLHHFIYGSHPLGFYYIPSYVYTHVSLLQILLKNMSIAW